MVENRPDIALPDMNFPGMSGIEFARWLKTEAHIPFPVRIVSQAIHTGLNRAEEIRKLHQTQIDLNAALRNRHGRDFRGIARLAAIFFC